MGCTQLQIYLKTTLITGHTLDRLTMNRGHLSWLCTHYLINRLTCCSAESFKNRAHSGAGNTCSGTIDGR